MQSELHSSKIEKINIIIHEIDIKLCQKKCLLNPQLYFVLGHKHKICGKECYKN